MEKAKGFGVSKNARHQTDRIWAKLETLKSDSAKHQKRLTGKYADGGYRQIMIDHDIAIYRIDNVRKIVYAVTVLYRGRNR